MTQPAHSSDEQSWRGRVVVVTGSSSGIGRAIAVELARRGAAVIVHGRTVTDQLQQTAREIEKSGAIVTMIAQDLTRHDELPDFVENCWNWQGIVSAWINNAGADILTGDAAGIGFFEKFHRLWAVDLLGTIHLSRLIGQRMQEAYRHKPADFAIVNMGWDQAEQGMEGDSGQLFGTVKGAIATFSKSLAQDLAPAVRVNVVAPGWIKTAWGETASTAWQQRATKESMSGRWGQPEDVARVVAMLVDPRSSFVNGQVWQVNGGFRYRQT